MSEWFQQSLTPPVVYEINIRVGIIQSEDHAQVLAEMKDPTTGVQIAMWSIPHGRLADVPTMLDKARDKAADWFFWEVDPF